MYSFILPQYSRLQNSSEKGTGRFLKKAPQKLLEWVWLDIVTAIPCATIYRNCKTQEIVERVRRDPTLLTVTGFRVLDFVSIRVLQLAIGTSIVYHKKRTTVKRSTPTVAFFFSQTL